MVCKDFQVQRDPQVTKDLWATLASMESLVSKVGGVHLAMMEQQVVWG